MKAEIREIENAIKNTSNREKALWYFFGFMVETGLLYLSDKDLCTIADDIKRAQARGDFSP